MSPEPAPSLCWRLVLLGVAVAVFAYLAWVPSALSFLGIFHPAGWFSDLYAILASIDAWRAGMDPYLVNHLDPLNRPHVYSHWWFWLAHLGFTRLWVIRLGVILGLTSFVALVAPLRPRSLTEMLWTLAIICSPPVFLAFERGNNDLIVFILLAPLVCWLQSERAVLRWSALVLLALAAGLKFYPAAAFLLLLGFRDGEARRRLWAGLIVLGAVIVSVYPDYARIRGTVPKPGGPMTFGAVNLATSLGVPDAWQVPVSLAGAALIAVGFVASGFFRGWDPVGPARRDWLKFVLGATLLCGCYFTWANYGYRWVLVAWAVPFLWRLRTDDSAPPRPRLLARIVCLVLPCLMWADPLFEAFLNSPYATAPLVVRTAQMNRFVAGEQVVVAVVFVAFTGFVAHFAWTGLLDLVAGTRAVRAEEAAKPS